MTYRDTARAFVAAESNTYGPGRHAAAALLPMSEWGEANRDGLTPETVAANHALHVADRAAELRGLLRPEGYDWHDAMARGVVSHRRYRLELAARALLAAIGEGEA